MKSNDSQGAALEILPIPIAVHQDEKLVFVNRALRSILRMLRLNPDEIVRQGQSIWDSMVTEEHYLSRENLRRLAAGEIELTNIERTYCDSSGNKLKAIGSIRHFEWDGRPAFIAVMVLLGLLGADGELVDAGARRLQSLTDRQRQTVLLAVEGHSNGRVAEIMGVKESTVRDHLKSAHKIMGTGSRSELVSSVLRQLEMFSPSTSASP